MSSLTFHVNSEPKLALRAARLHRCRNLLAFHRTMASMLKHARAVGANNTAATYAAQLRVNARVLRSKLLGAA